MIYIDNNTTGFTIPRITSGIGDKVILINQITKRRFELSTDVLNDVGYKVDITDLKLEIGQYDYVVKKNNIPLESGILQVGGYKSQNNQYEVDFNIIQYEPNIVYTPLPEKVLNVTENGVYNVESFDKVDVDVDVNLSLIEELEQELEAKLEEINNLQIEVEEKTSQIQTLQTENTNLQQQIEEKEGNISELEAQIEENNSLIASLQQDIDNLNQQIVDLTASILEKDDEITSLNNQINSVTSLSITENGTYTPGEGILGWNVVEVNAGGSWQVPDGTVFKSSTFTTVSGLDTSNVTTFNKMFYDCINLTTISQLNTSKGINFSSMFQNCSKLTTIPQLNTSNGTNFNGMFSGCSKLTEIPQLNTSNGTNFGNMFNNCSNLTTIPQLDTSNSTGFLNMFGSCSKLTTVPQLNISKSTFLGNMFNNCASLKNITFVGSINANIDFSPCPSLTYESVKSILTACSNTTNTNSKTLKFDRTLTDQNGELAELVAICNTKGWTISGLTLQ